MRSLDDDYGQFCFPDSNARDSHTRVTLFQFVSVFGNCYSERLVGHTSVEDEERIAKIGYPPKERPVLPMEQTLMVELGEFDNVTDRIIVGREMRVREESGLKETGKVWETNWESLKRKLLFYTPAFLWAYCELKREINYDDDAIEDILHTIRLKRWEAEGRLTLAPSEPLKCSKTNREQFSSGTGIETRRDVYWKSYFDKMSNVDEFGREILPTTTGELAFDVI